MTDQEWTWGNPAEVIQARLAVGDPTDHRDRLRAQEEALQRRNERQDQLLQMQLTGYHGRSVAETLALHFGAQDIADAREARSRSQAQVEGADTVRATLAAERQARRRAELKAASAIRQANSAHSARHAAEELTRRAYEPPRWR